MNDKSEQKTCFLLHLDSVGSTKYVERKEKYPIKTIGMNNCITRQNRLGIDGI